MIVGEVACSTFVIAGARVGAAGVDVIAGAAGVGVPAAAAFCALAGVAVRRVAPSRPELSKP
jgi:hypothetical protein